MPVKPMGDRTTPYVSPLRRDYGTPDLEIGQPTMLQSDGVTPSGEYRPMSPDAMAMVDKLVKSGMSMDLAQTAVLEYMGFDKPNQQQVAWDNYERQHPYMAAAKKQLNAGYQAAKEIPGATKRLFLDWHVDNEKRSAAKMLKDYVLSQNAVRANEQIKGKLWSIASQAPGTWQSGVALTNDPTRNNQIMAEQSNQDYMNAYPPKKIN